MKLPKFALAGVLTLAALVASVGVAGAETNTSGNSLMKPMVSQRDFQAKDGQAKDFKQGKERGKSQLFSTAAQLLNMEPSALAAELKSGKNLQDIVKAKNMDPVKFAEDLQKSLYARVDQAAQSGKLTSEKAAKIKEKIPQHVQAMMEGKWKQNHNARKGIFKGVGTQVQALLSIDAAILKAELQSGKSLAEIAQAKGISKNQLISTIKAEMEKNLDQAVKEQTISTEEAAKIKEKLPQKIDAMVSKQHK